MAAEKFNLSWNEFGNNVIKTFHNLLIDKNFTDVTLVSDDGKQIEAHKTVLASCSQFFNQILLENPHQHPLLFLKGIKHSELLAIMKFIYLGETDVAQDELKHFMEVSADLQIKGLHENEKQISDERDSSSPFETDSSLKVVEEEVFDIDIMKSDSLDDEGSTEVISVYDHGQAKEQKYYDLKIPKVDGRYFCDRCDYTTKELSNIRRHQIGKHDRVRFECDQCERKYSTKTNLQTHKLVKHEGKKYLCRECNTEFTAPSNLSNHKAKVHKLL